MTNRTEASTIPLNPKSHNVLKQGGRGKSATTLKNERSSNGIEILRNTRKIESRWDQSCRQMRNLGHKTEEWIGTQDQQCKSRRVPIGDGQGPLLWS